MIRIIYRDDAIVVCVKPAGVISQDAGENSLPQLLIRQLNIQTLYPVHRLDREVGGLMVFALSKQAAAKLSRSVQEHLLEKIYLAVLRGIPAEGTAILEDLLFHDRIKNKTYVVGRSRKGVKDAKLDYLVLETAQAHTLVRVRLHTGRTHQIRVQFASRQLPLVGDRKYGGKDNAEGFGLWAHALAFPHPQTGKIMTFRQEPPGELPWSLFSSQTEHENKG